MASHTSAYSPLGAQIDLAHELKDLIVTTAKINDLAVTAGKLADNAVETAKIKDAQVTPAKLKDFVGLKYVASDLVTGVVNSSTAETTIASVTIPANTVITGALYFASIVGGAPTAGNIATFKLKSGVSGSEALRQTHNYEYTAASHHGDYGGSIDWYDTAPTFTGDVSVIITGQNTANDSQAHCTVYGLIVVGF